MSEYVPVTAAHETIFDLDTDRMILWLQIREELEKRGLKELLQKVQDYGEAEWRSGAAFAKNLYGVKDE